MDNKLFNVNGLTKEMLCATLKLALQNDGHSRIREPQKVSSYIIDKEKGFVLCWSEQQKGSIAFPIPLVYETITGIAFDWIHSEAAKSTNLIGWEKDSDHDGENELGWRVYCEDWGHVGSINYAIVAIKPCYIWYGK